MSKWKKVPPHRNPNYERVSTVRLFDDSLKVLPEVIAFARDRDAVLTVGPRDEASPKPVYRLRKRQGKLG